MSTFVFVNNFSTTLAAALTSTATTATLASSTGLPTLASGQIMPLTLNDAATGQIYEILYVTAISGATLTIERAQEGTAAQAWAIGDYAKCMPTAQSVEPLGGNPAKTFQVNTATASSNAIPLSQLGAPLSVQGPHGVSIGANYYQEYTISFTAPSNGVIFAIGKNNLSAQATAAVNCAIYINSTELSYDNTILSQTHFGSLSVTAGSSNIVSFIVSAGTTNPAVAATAALSMFFVPTT